MKAPSHFSGDWETITLAELEQRGHVGLFRGKVISQKDIDRLPGDYPIYSSSVHADGLFGCYGDHMFDEELITWSIDGGGHFFHRPRHKFSVTNVCGYLRIRIPNIDYRYLAYHLRNLHSQEVFDYTLKAHPSVIRGAYRIQLPRSSEQRAIATVLSDVDELIGSLEALIAKKRAIKQAAMQELLTGTTRLPGFGGEWEMRRLGNLGTFSKGRGIRRTDLRKTGVGCVRYGELYTRYENYVSKPVSKVPQDIADIALPIRRGDLMFAASGETADEIGICVAYVSSEPAYAGGDIIVLRASGQDAVYLAHLLNAPVAARQKTRMAQGDAVVHIRADHLAAIEVPLPPLPEQHAIATTLSDMDAEIAALDHRLDKTRAIKQGMMQQLLTGYVRLPIPDDDTEDDDTHDA